MEGRPAFEQTAGIENPEYPWRAGKPLRAINISAKQSPAPLPRRAQRNSHRPPGKAHDTEPAEVSGAVRYKRSGRTEGRAVTEMADCLVTEGNCAEATGSPSVCSWLARNTGERPLSRGAAGSAGLPSGKQTPSSPLERKRRPGLDWKARWSVRTPKT